MATTKTRITELPAATTTAGLVTIAADTRGNNYKVSLDQLCKDCPAQPTTGAVYWEGPDGPAQPDAPAVITWE